MVVNFEATAAELVGPQQPDGELQSFRLADDKLRMELVAAEPDVVSPVAIAWDADGRLLVAEMTDYPSALTGGQIKLLEDRDGDGKLETVTVFADKLQFPNCVMPWNGGVLVTSAPNIWYLKDTDGDGRADERRIVLTGFGEGNQQLRANGLHWGLDNWIYGANGRSDGSLRRPELPAEKGVSIRLHDFRFHPETGEVEAVTGFSQFGLARDDWGHRFPSWNTIPMRHVVLEEKYLSRNTHLAQTTSVASILDTADAGRVYSISPPPTTFNHEPVDYFNASCGLTIYRGQQLGREYSGDAFVCESLTNLVHRRVLTPVGPTFAATRAEQNQEFLAATDPWFHPVNLTTGPDGSLYVVDFYRQSVEHPQFVPEAVRQTVDFRKGSNHGRIWRIRRREVALSPAPKLGKIKSAELVEYLGHANGWVRDTAQRLLVERREATVVPQLRQGTSQSNSSLARSHALWTLQGLQQLDDATLLASLRDKASEVREQALRLLEGRVANSAALRAAVLELADDPDERVRFRCALVLGEFPGPEATQALARIARHDISSEWLRLAILCSPSETAWPFLQSLLKQQPGWLTTPTADQSRFMSQVATLVGASHRESELAAMLDLLTQLPTNASSGKLALLAGWAEGLSRHGHPVHEILANPPVALAKQISVLQELLVKVRSTVVSQESPVTDRLLAVRILIEIQPEVAGSVLLDLLQPKQPAALQTAAARGLANIGGKMLAIQVLDRWSDYTILTRREVLTALLRTAEQASAVVDGIEQEKLVAADLDAVAREALQRIPNSDLQQRIKVLFPQEPSDDRQEVIRKYQVALSLKGENTRGAELFAKNCLTCHQLRGRGQRVGPDLSGVRSRPKATLLTDILDPNKEVAPDYRSYVLLTTRGQVLTGLLAAETATSITLRRAEGAEDTILRGEIEALRASGKTLMPEGLDRLLNPQAVADLLEFLREPIALPDAK